MSQAECPFCGFDDPDVTVYADRLVLAIVSRSPINRHHVMVLPRAHVEHLPDLPPATAERLIRVAQHVSRAVREASGCDAVTHITEDDVAGAGVNLVAHLKLHVIPRFSDDGVVMDWNRAEDPGDEVRAGYARRAGPPPVGRGLTPPVPPPPDFYDALAPYYHLIFPDWEASMRRQGDALDALLRARSEWTPRTVLDVACGIGTQALPLAALGYDVTASDLSPAAVERADHEVRARGLAVAFSVADMREAARHHGRAFDVVIACDNSVPHLLTDADIGRAFDQFYRCTAPGGLCAISVRDYDALERGGVQVHPYGVRDEAGVRYVLFQVWEWAGRHYYDTTMYVVEHPSGGEPVAHSARSRVYAVSIPTLAGLMERAGFVEVERVDGAFYQPVLVGRRPAV
ncbi:MAG TPA: methyltransferase domain-containing protein [Rubricoccaceae bacterium]|jgi:diadenosine tetraphosphate (Ap4A) HIT family hydrolase/SAM-dependent methyltransferase